MTDRNAIQSLRDDVSFLNELETRIKRSNEDIIQYEMALKMVQDWRDEIRKQLKAENKSILCYNRKAKKS